MSAPVVWEHQLTDEDGSRVEAVAGGDWFEVTRLLDADGAVVEGQFSLAPEFSTVWGSRAEVANALWALAAEALCLAVALRGEQ